MTITTVDPLSRLSPHQRRVAELVAEGCSNYEIAYKVSRTPNTIKNILQKIYRMLEIDATNQRVALARMVWESQVDALVSELLQQEAA